MATLATTVDSFVRVLATSQARRLVLGGLIGRFREAGTGLALVLAVRGVHASFAVAGLASAAYLAGAAVTRPLHGRWVDRAGTRAPLLIASSANAAILVAVAVAAWQSAPAWSLVVLSVGAGMTLPALSAALRSMWSHLVGLSDSEHAYALDTLSYELSLIASPALVGVIAVRGSPSVALLVVAALGMTGTAAVAIASPPRDRTGRDAGGDRLIDQTVVWLIVVSFLVGGAEGAMTVLAPGVASAHRDDTAAGLLLSAFSAGSLLGVLAYGALGSDRGTLFQRLVAATTGLTAAFLVLALLGDGLAGFAACGSLVGFALSPALTIGFVAIRDVAPPRALTEAFTWASFAAAAGAAASQAVGGVLIAGPGPRAALWLPVALAAAAIAAAVAANRTVSPQSTG